MVRASPSSDLPVNLPGNPTLPDPGLPASAPSNPAHTTVVPSTQNELLITIAYDNKGTDWADLKDNHILAWVIDSNEPPNPPEPRSITVYPYSENPPITEPIVTPNWAVGFIDTIYVPDIFRGSPLEFYTWLATNNGAQRKVGGANLRNEQLVNTFDQWSRQNPNLVYTKE
jgi:hypothetical protein